MLMIILIILGLCFGSFINALVWRVHQQAKSKKNSHKYSITKGHSMCPRCKHRLHARDLVPILSWIEVRGRCRYCHTKISWQYPLVELLTAGLFVASYLYWPYDFSAAGILAFTAWLVSLVILIALVVYDIRWMLLPNKLVYPLIVTTGVLAGSIALQAGNWKTLAGSLLGAVFLSGLFWGIFQVSDGAWIGGGDVKLAVALGLIAGGLLEGILLLFIASLAGSIISIPLVLRNKKLSQKVPFGPFLIIAAIIVFFWAQTMIDQYTRFIGV